MTELSQNLKVFAPIHIITGILGMNNFFDLAKKKIPIQ
jgi:hypothetical protein